MQKDGTYRKKEDKQNKINIQELFIEEAKLRAIGRPKPEAKARDRVLPFMINPITRLEKYFSR